MMQKIIASIVLAVTVSATAHAQNSTATPTVPAAGLSMAVPPTTSGVTPGVTGSVVPGAVPLTGAANEVVRLPLNKTLQLQLPSAVRDVIVGNQAIADVIVRSPTQLFLLGRAVGDTNVFLLDANGKIIERFEINVQPDTEAIKSLLTQLLPNENIGVDGAGDSIVLSGSVSSDGVVEQARNIARRFVKTDEMIVNMLRVSSEQQVLLQVRVAEMSKSALKEVGVGTNFDQVSILGGTASIGTTAIGLTAAGPALNALFDLKDIDITLSLLEQRGLAKKLAEPNLVTVSGESANLLVGGEFPIPVPQDANTLTIEFKQFGVSLAFLPVVLDSGRISLKIATEVSSLSAQGAISLPFFGATIQVPALQVRRANSVVELPSGGSIMIAGLLQSDIINGLNGVPGIMDVPVLGALFRSSSFQRQETDLVILVNAVLVKPQQPQVLALPTDGFAPASDLDRYFLGHLQNIYVKQPVPKGNNAPALEGPIGYIVQ